LITALVQLYRLNANPNIQNGRQPALVWLDMDLYKRVRKIPFLDPQFSGRIIESPGPFHTVLCALRCLGVTLESSGLDQAWVEADLYSNVTFIQILNGKHHNRALDANQVTLQALCDLWFDAFFEHYPELRVAMRAGMNRLTEACKTGTDIAQVHSQLFNIAEILNLKRHMEEFDQLNEKYPMYKWTRMYMNQVMNLLQFLRATRDSNWLLHLASLERMCLYFSAYNRHDYAQNIPEHIAHMHHLRESNPKWKFHCQHKSHFIYFSWSRSSTRIC
jgi:hypothetical protein